MLIPKIRYFQNAGNPYQEDSRLDRKRVLVTLAGGGFLWEAQALIKGMGKGYDYHFVTTPDAMDKVNVVDIPDGPVHIIAKPTTMNEKSSLKKVKNTLRSFRDVCRVIRKVDLFAVICIGSSIAVPLCLWAKCFRKKAIFVETITRISKPSLTGKIISTLRLCDRFYVQWPEAVNLYKGAIYAGTVL
jgi:UDP-N-acetylglucosamine:LPS N-acetylglucosamine transferase